MFESRVVKTDVTAVKLINNFVLAGIGNFLHIFDLNGKFLKKLNVFDGQKIHGINLDDVTDTLLLYGGCYMQTITCNFLQCEFTKLHAKTVHGWVLTSRWLKSKWIAAVVMLNKLLIFDGQLNILREIVCAEKCILYSAFISYNDIDELVVLSGTVFGEIVIWKVNHFNIQESSPVVKRLTGHKGVIFSISYNEEAGYICSSSDDRSTILWSIEKKSIHSELQRTHCNILLHRKIYGHQSRVFRSLLLQNLIVTAGEDSTVNVWDFEGQLIKKITHQGGPIWALDGNTDVVVSGGGDCGVLISSVQSNSLCNSLLLPENYNPKRIGLLRSSNLVVITEDGVLFYYARNLNMWIKIDQHKVLQSYNVLEVSKCKSLFSLSGYHGEIFIYQEEENSARLLELLSVEVF
nr:PREDICTED: WD repeat-containing protein 6 isoform X3 [Tribolium castaneum]|eukprot:XP_015835133.1 PREDICTED: WD repeat-containing protein 6 isoform X3 [Tribolium castaneum]